MSKKNDSKSTASHQRKEVFTIIEGENLERPIFRRIGSAFVNRDDSLNILLDALPVSGKLHVRDPLPPREDDQPVVS